MSESDLHETEPSAQTALEDGPQGDAPVASPGTPAGVGKKGKSIMADSVVRRLTFLALALVVLYLVAVASALLTGILGGEKPRTMLERDIQYYEQKAMQTPNDATMWQEYVSALITAKQYAQAADVLDRAQAAVEETGTASISTARAQLQFAKGDYDEAIETCNSIQLMLKDYYSAQRKTPGTPEYLGAPVSDNYYDSLVIEAESYAAKGDDEAALACLDEYLKDRPRAADVLIRRGDLRADVGNTAGAEEDYREALRYLPGDAAALDGLKRIGAEQ